MARSGPAASPRGRVVLTMWGVDYTERGLITEARRILGGPVLPATPLADALARGSRAGFYPVRHKNVRLPVVHDSMQDHLQYRAAFGVPPWVPSGRESDLMPAINAAARAYLDADGRVVLDWNVTVMDAMINDPSD